MIWLIFILGAWWLIASTMGPINLYLDEEKPEEVEPTMDYDTRHEMADDLGYENLYRDEEPCTVDWDSWLDVPEPDWAHDDADLPVFPKADDEMQDGEITEGV